MTMNDCLPVECPDVLAQTVRCWKSAHITPIPADLNGSSPSDPTNTPHYFSARDPLHRINEVGTLSSSGLKPFLPSPGLQQST
jgi:hypothetical protein